MICSRILIKYVYSQNLDEAVREQFQHRLLSAHHFRKTLDNGLIVRVSIGAFGKRKVCLVPRRIKLSTKFDVDCHKI